MVYLKKTKNEILFFQGKSTLLNSLLGIQKFQSGFSAGKGLTSSLKIETSEEGVNYGDTPVSFIFFLKEGFAHLFVKCKGLADVALRKTAAEEITKALRMNGRFKIVFVVSIEAGRVRADDITTIDLVMESIHCPAEFAVVINKVGKKAKKNFKSNEEQRKLLFTSLNSGEHKTMSIFLNELMEELEDEDDMLHKFEVLDKFISSLEFSFIPPDKVVDIEIDKFEKKKEENEIKLTKFKEQVEARESAFQESMKKLERENEMMAAKKQEELDGHQAELDRIRKHEEETKRHYAELIERQQKEYIESMKKSNEEQRKRLEEENVKMMERIRREQEEKEQMLREALYQNQLITRQLQEEIQRKKKKRGGIVEKLISFFF